ncbi:MAG: biotin--[acetyl-CoA-carboxylase] ligase, partial [Proteobacteria bacterium]
MSGERLSVELGVSRTAVWKAVGVLRELGVDVDSLPRQGYRLAQPTTPLDKPGLFFALPEATRARLEELRVSWRTTSTNQDLLQRGAPAQGRFCLHVAESQSAGRGRRGRSWLAPPGGSLCLSWSWRFEAMPAHAGTLSLAIGLAAVRSLEALGIRDVRVKWPNDLVTDDGKLAGILIETVSEAGGPALVV